MAIPVKADIIYYRTPSDFELEFNLSGCCTMRLLSDRPQNEKDLLRSLCKAVARSQIILAVGKLQGDDPILSHICNAIGYGQSERDLSPFGLNRTAVLPDGSIPLISAGGQLGGCVIECGPQAIIVLTDDKGLRKSLMTDLVHQYVRDFYASSRAESHIAKATAAPRAPQEEDSVPLATEEADEQDIIEDIDVKQFTESFILKEEETPNTFDFSELEDEFLTEDKKKKGKAGRVFLTLFFVLLFLCVGAAAYIFIAEPAIIDNMYASYAEMYGKSGEYHDPDILDSFGELHDRNDDTVGFLTAEGLNLRLPVVTDADDPGHYESHLFEGFYSVLHGTPYTKQKIEPDTYLRNTVVFGRSIWGDRLLSSIGRLTTLEGYRSSPVISFDTLYSEGDYKVFAAFTVIGDGAESWTINEFSDDSQFLTYTDRLRSRSDIVTTVDVSEGDEILTLISYGGGKTTVVAARRVRIGESLLVDTQNAAQNSNPTGYESSHTSSEGDHPLFSVKVTPTVMFSEYSTRYEQYKAPAPYEPMTSSVVTSAESSDDSSSDFSDTSDGSSPESSSSEAQSEDTSSVINSAVGQILKVTNAHTGQVESGSATDILSRIVEAEMGKDFESEALKAQTIAAYSWLLKNGAADGEAPTVALKTASTQVIDAVKAVLGMKAYYQSDIAETMYFPLSAGHTATSESVWQVALPHLRSVDSSVDRNHSNYLTRRTYKADDVCRWVLECTEIDLSRTADKEKWFNLTYDSNGLYAETVRFGDGTEKYAARFLRDTVFASARAGENTLRSTAIRITYRSESDTFVFETKGWGHGVGMSQNGANELAKSGLEFEAILSRYYPGITVGY